MIYTFSACLTVWHPHCFKRLHDSKASASADESEEDEMSSGDEYVHCSASDMETDSEPENAVRSPLDMLTADKMTAPTDENSLSIDCTAIHNTTSNKTQYTELLNKSSKDEKSTTLAKAGLNFCFVCGEPQSKIARHFKVHAKEDMEIAKALSLPARSKKRKQLLKVLRNRGNFNHNSCVFRNGEGAIKVKRRAVQQTESAHKNYEFCLYCKGMFVRQELWRHMKRCQSKPAKSDDSAGGRHRVLTIAAVAKSAFSGQVDDGLMKVLSQMNDDEIARVVRNDFGLLQFAQSLYNRHGFNKTKHEYIRQKVRELARFILALRKKCPSVTLEDAMKPANFMNVIDAVKDTAGFNQDTHSYQTPSLALKIGHSLLKVSEILHCRALIAEDAELTNSAKAFQKLYKTKWSEYISHKALCTISDLKYNKPTKLPLTQDIDKLNDYLQRSAESAFQELSQNTTEHNYACLARLTLTRIILFNRHAELTNSAKAFQKLYKTKWSEYISHKALCTISDLKYNKPTKLPLTQDIDKLNDYLQRSAESAFQELSQNTTEHNYACLARLTLTRIILFNRRRVGEVSKMPLKNFLQRDDSYAFEELGLSAYEKHLCKYFTRVELKGKRGRKVAVLLNPDITKALELLVEKRKQCGVLQDNEYLFAAPKGNSCYRGHDCLKKFAAECGASHPEYLRSTQLRKQVATTSQILNLKHNELDQLADFLGHNISVHREYYRLPDATVQVAKISKLLLALEKGMLPELRGKTLDEIKDFTDEDDDQDDSDEDTSGTRPQHITSGNAGKKTGGEPGGASSSSKNAELERQKTKRTYVKRPWAPSEIKSAMKFFGEHIKKGKLATLPECEACKKAEHPVLDSRTIQNIRDYVRNKGIAHKRQTCF
ncbi:hypothetical protein IRJ41_000533 [Triplophysa rosa]|uniref:Uncharacterized protein n=1 Tax=Triplophysa rosa TaxID=992332 RepID=A0A9W7WPS5_TRIRA|nr:hypothetical protein IRJ41_000533 [Triplophysa rosa]